MHISIGHNQFSKSVIEDDSEKRKIVFWDGVHIVLKMLGLLLWIVVLLLMLLELKMYFNLDLIPGVDTPVDQVYYYVNHNVFSP